MSNSYEEIQGIAQKITEIKKQATAQVCEILKKASAEYFQSNPEVAYITWTQFTPWFQDGDECVFSVNESFAVSQQTYSDDEGFQRGWGAEKVSIVSYSGNATEEFIEECGSKERALEVVSNTKKIQAAISAIPDDIMESAFGNHVSVTLHKDGVEIEEYEHE